MSRKKQRFEQMREESSTAIRQAAMLLFARKGYGHTSMDEIAREAGVSKGLIYNYFKSKETLLETLITEGLTRLHHLECRVYEKKLPAREMLKHLLEAILQAIEQEPNYWKLYIQLLTRTELIQNMKTRILQFTQQSLQRMERIFKELKTPNPALEARLFAATLDGLLLHYLFDPASYPIDEMKQYLFNRFSQHLQA